MRLGVNYWVNIAMWTHSRGHCNDGHNVMESFPKQCPGPSRWKVKSVNLRFHWMLPKSGEVATGSPQTPQQAARYRVESTSIRSPAARPEMEGWLHFARCAEEAGIESVLVALNHYEPDPLIISCALGQATKQLKFIAAYRSGLMQPTTFVQQVNTLSGLIQGRIDLNIVAGSSTAEQHAYGDF